MDGSLVQEVGINYFQQTAVGEDEQEQCMLGVLEMGIVGTDEEERTS